MNHFHIKNIILHINKDDLIELNKIEDSLALVRLNFNDLKLVLSKIFPNDCIKIIDYFYYGVNNNEIVYEVKFYLEYNND